MRGFWAVRRPAWVAGGLAVAVVVLTVWLLRAKSGVNTATVLSLTVSVLSLAVAVRGLVPTSTSSKVARELADRVERERGRARRQALGMTGDARPADMAFRAPVAGEEPELVRWRSDGGTEYGTLRNVAGFYRSLDRGRMVVLGEPGAGKTVLATQLVIDLIEGLPDSELQPGARPPVPVWLTLTSVDLGQADWLARASAEELAAQLDQQMAAQIAAVYQISRSAADRLIRERWVLPVLDGLDEMDTPEPGAAGLVRPRAAAVVRALNAGTGRRPVVLVSRRGEYGQLARSATGGGEDPVLQDARQIVLQPLDVPAICDYLTRRFPGDRPGQLASRWDGVRAALQAPAAAGQGAGLAGVLSSPWQLFLAATAYQDDTSDPGELIRRPADELGEYLLGQLIPAVARRTARPDGDHYQPDQVRAWLGTLARHLDQTSNDPELRWSPTDLPLERLWPIGGTKAVRWLSTLANLVILGAGFAVLGLLWVHANGRWYPDTRPAWGGFIAGIVGIVYYASFLTANTDPTLNRLNLRLTSHASRRKLAGALAFGQTIGLAGGLAFSLAYGRAGELAAGPLLGLAVGLGVGLRDNFSLAVRPSTVMRQNITYALAGGLAVGLAFVLAFGRGGALTFGLAGGLAVGLAGGLAVGLAVWTRYLIGCWLAQRKGMLPRRVGHFLDWAYQANLLRMAGTAAQFRHRELQDWLISLTQDHPAQTVREQESKTLGLLYNRSKLTGSVKHAPRGARTSLDGDTFVQVKAVRERLQDRRLLRKGHAGRHVRDQREPARPHPIGRQAQGSRLPAWELPSPSSERGSRRQMREPIVACTVRSSCTLRHSGMSCHAAFRTWLAAGPGLLPGLLEPLTGTTGLSLYRQVGQSPPP
jgi:hypothetical protein